MCVYVCIVKTVWLIIYMYNAFICMYMYVYDNITYMSSFTLLLLLWTASKL